MTTGDATDFLAGLHKTKSVLESALAKQAENTVQSGPFRGLVLPEVAVDSILPKLLGCYEAELHPAIEAAINWRPDVVANIGCAEGFYAIGLARRLPEADLIAFDSAEAERRRCHQTALVNAVGDRLRVFGTADSAQLNRFFENAARPFVVCDCEGCERHLLDATSIPALSRARMIVELHDRPGHAEIRRTLDERFSVSHSLAIVRSGARDPGAFELIRSLNQFLQMLAVCEFRDWTMEWMILSPLEDGRS